MKIQDLTPEDFEKELEKSDKPLLVDFWAEWCHPCQMMGQTLAELVEPLEGKIRVFKLNIDGAMDLCRRHKIVSIPAILIFKGGKEVDRVVGAVPRDILLEKIQTHCP
jgi:thioredoxin 1